MIISLNTSYIDIMLAQKYDKAVSDMDVLFHNNLESIVRMPVLEALNRSPAFSESIPRLLEHSILTYAWEEENCYAVLNMNVPEVMSGVLCTTDIPRTTSVGCLAFSKAREMKRESFIVLQTIYNLQRVMPPVDVTKAIISKTTSLNLTEVEVCLNDLYVRGIIRVKQCIVLFTTEVKPYTK